MLNGNESFTVFGLVTIGLSRNSDITQTAAYNGVNKLSNFVLSRCVFYYLIMTNVTWHSIVLVICFIKCFISSKEKAHLKVNMSEKTDICKQTI